MYTNTCICNKYCKPDGICVCKIFARFASKLCSKVQKFIAQNICLFQCIKGKNCYIYFLAEINPPN